MSQIPHTNESCHTQLQLITLETTTGWRRLKGSYESSPPCTAHHTATYCNTLQQTTTHCNTLQHNTTHNTTHCNSNNYSSSHSYVTCAPKLQIIFHKRATKYRSLLQKMTHKDKGSYESSPAVQHITLQHTTTHCNKLQHTATHCNSNNYSSSHLYVTCVT